MMESPTFISKHIRDRVPSVWATCSFLRIQPNLGGGIVGTTTFGASALPSGFQIDSSQPFDGRLMYQIGPGCGGGAHGRWLYAYKLYLGLKFLIAGQVHYGWAQLSTQAGGTNTLYGFAYETIPFKRILTGQTMDSPDEPTMDSGSAGSKVPGSTGSIAPSGSDASQLQSAGDEPTQWRRCTSRR